MTEFEALQQQVARMAEEKRELRGQVQDEALARAKAEADVQGLELELEAVRVARDADVVVHQEDNEKLVRMAREDLDKATKRITELNRELDRALDAILLASSMDNWGPAHDLCVKHERILPGTPRPKDVLGELHGQLAAMRSKFETITGLLAQEGCSLSESQVHQMIRDIAILLKDDAGAPEAEVIKAARPFMEAVPSWDCNEDDQVTVAVTARQTAALCRAFDIMDGKRDEDETK